MATIASSRVPATAPGAVDTSSSHPYTCNTCQVAFRNSELQRTHMRSDWHRYNLKRRVTSLPPITSEVFAEKVLAAQADTKEAATKAAYERSCRICEKTYFSENAYQNHIGSQKHRAKVAISAQGSVSAMDDASSVVSSTFSLGEPVATHNDSDDEDSVSNVAAGVEKATLGDVASNTASSHATPNASVPASEAETSEHSTVNLNRCLFCNYDSPTVPLNVLHMERIHGMFIPEQKYLVDLEGLIGSLRERIYEYHECLYCAKLKPTVFGLQTHMRDKGHCKIAFDTEDQQLEIGEFYDFRSTYSDGGNDSEDEDDAGVKLGMKRPTKIINEDGDDEEVEEGDGWETDSSASSLDSEDLTAVPLDQRTHQYEKLHKHPHHSRDDPRPHHNADGWHSHAHKHANAVFYSDYELHLPSGRAVGHRSLAKYYRQNLVNHPSPSERQEQEQLRIQAREGRTDSDDEEDQQVSRRERGRAVASRANGGTGMIGVSETKKKEVRAEEKRSRKVAERAQRRQEWGNNKQSNSQKHFRDPLLQ